MVGKGGDRSWGFPGGFVTQCHLLRLFLQDGWDGAAQTNPAHKVKVFMPAEMFLWLFTELGHRPGTVSNTALVSQMEIFLSQKENHRVSPQIHFCHSSFHPYTWQPNQHPEHPCQALSQHSVVPLGLHLSAEFI